MSEGEFVRKANQICLQAAEERQQATVDASQDGADSEAAEAVVEALVAPVDEMAEELGDLGPPRGDKAEVVAIVEAFESGIEKLEAEPVSPDSASAFSRANELALGYGLTDCRV